jgi:hypothetical protein
MLLDSRESRKRNCNSDRETLQSQVTKAGKKRLSLSGLEEHRHVGLLAGGQQTAIIELQQRRRNR